MCPHDNGGMHQVSVPARFGQTVVIDQCGSCGGLWFDAFELYKVSPDSGELLESLNADSLRTPTDLGQSVLNCPHDKVALYQFEDARFPSELVLMRCPKCQGFWLNRGEFSRFQTARKNLLQPNEKSLKDKPLDEKVQRILDRHSARNSGDVLGSLGSFLSTPVGERPVLPMDTERGYAENDNVLKSVIDALMLILRVFVFK